MRLLKTIFPTPQDPKIQHEPPAAVSKKSYDVEKEINNYKYHDRDNKVKHQQYHRGDVPQCNAPQKVPVGQHQNYHLLSQDINPDWFQFSPVQSTIFETQQDFKRPYFEWDILRESLSNHKERRSLLKVTTDAVSKDESNNIVKVLSGIGGVVFWNIREQIDMPHGEQFEYMNSILVAAKEQRVIQPDFLVVIVERISDPDLRPEQVLSMGNFAVVHNIPIQVVYNDHILDLTQLGMGAFKLFENPLITISLRPELATSFSPDEVKKDVLEAQTDIKRILGPSRTDSKNTTKIMSIDDWNTMDSYTSDAECKDLRGLRAKKRRVMEDSFFDLRSRQNILEFLETTPRHASRDNRPCLARISQFLVRYLQEDRTRSSPPNNHTSMGHTMEPTPCPLSEEKQRRRRFTIRNEGCLPQFQSVFHSRGQKYIGSKFDAEEYQNMITMMETLRMNGLLKDLGEEQLIEYNAGGENENEEILAVGTKFKNALEDIEKAAMRNDHPVWLSIQEEHGSSFMNNLFEACREDLRTKKVRVWEVIRTDTQSGHLFDSCFHVENLCLDESSSSNQAYKTVSFSKQEEAILHVYVNRSMSKPAEAIIYSYARAFSALSHTACVLLESLLLPKYSEFNDNTYLLSTRIKQWLKVAPHMELARLIVNERLEFNTNNQMEIGGSFSNYSLPSLCAQQVSFLCQQRLEKQDNDATNLLALNEACIEDSAWAKLFDDAAWSKPSLDALLFVLSAGMRPQYPLLRHMHQRIIDEMIASVRRANPYSIRHPDLITVYNETLGRTDGDMQRIFGLSKHQISRVLYTQLREKYCKEDPSYSSFLPQDGPYERKEERLLSNDLYTRKYFDSLYFLPFCMRFQVSLVMPEEHQSAITWAILLALLLGGAMIVVINDVGSYFKWEYCFAHHLVIQQWTLVGFMTIIPVFILCVSGVAILVSGKSFLFAIIFASFYFLFNMMFLLLGVIFFCHSKSIWRSNEGKVGMLALFLNLFWALPVFLIPDLIPHQWHWAVEATGLLLSCLVLGFGYLYLNGKKSSFFRDLTFTPTDDLMKAIGHDSENQPGSSISRRAAREKFVGAVQSHSLPKSINPEFRKLVQQRRAQRHREELIIEWYVKVFKQPLPTIGSEAWDSTLGKAQIQMILMSKTDILSRVGAFNKNLGKKAFMAAIFYVALMLDHFLHFILINATTEPNGSSMIKFWCHTYLVLAFAGNEAVPLRMGAAERTHANGINVDKPSVYEEYMISFSNRRKQRYASDFRKILTVVLPLATTISGVGAAYTLRWEISFKLGAIWFSRIISYTGLVLAYYNLMFLTRPMTLRMIMCLSSGIPLGTAAAISTMLATGDSSFAVLALGICAWVMFFFSCLFVGKQSNEGAALYDIVKDDATLFAQHNLHFTSGQMWIGGNIAILPNGVTTSSTPLDDAIRAIEEQQQEGNTSFINYECAVGETIVGLMRESARSWSNSRLSDLPSSTYVIAASGETPTRILEDIIRDWKDGKIIVEQYAEEVTLFDPSSCSCYSGVGKRMEDGVLRVFVGVGDINDIFEHAKRVAETIIHEYVELVQGKHHHAAVLSELLIHGGQIAIPSRIMYQIELMGRDSLEQMLEGTVMALIRASTRGFADALSENWISLKASDRKTVVRRLNGVFNDSDEVICEGHCMLSLRIHKACWERLQQLQHNDHPQIMPKYHLQRSTRQDFSQSIEASEGTNRFKIAKQTFFYICFLQIIGDHSVDHELFHASTKSTEVNDGGLPYAPCFILRTLGLSIHRFVKRASSFITWRVQLSRQEVQELYDEIESLNEARLVRREILSEDTPGKGHAFEERWQDNGEMQKVFITSDRRALYWVDGDECEMNAGFVDELEAEETMAVKAKLTLKDTVDSKHGAVAEYYEDLRADPKHKVRFIHMPDLKSRYPVKEEYFQISLGQVDKLVMTVTLDRHGWPTHGTLNMGRGKKAPFELIWPSIDWLTGVHPTHAIVQLGEDTLEIRWFLNGDNEWSLEYVTWQGIRSTKLNRKGETGDWVSFGTSSGNRSISCDTPAFVRTKALDIIRLLVLIQAHHIRNPLVPILPKAPDRRFHSSAWPLCKNMITCSSSHSTRDFYALGVPRTKAARTALWQAWNQGKIEGFFAQMWDEVLLRKEPSLKRYWSLRDVGRYVEAAESLELNFESICAICMIRACQKGIMALFCYRMQDLCIMGIGGQSLNLNCGDQKDIFPTITGEEYKLRVAGLDSGTWPFDGGGVASCRRDLVDRLPRLSWTMFPEVGNTMKEIKYQFETNIESIAPIWMWGCDIDGPNQRILSTIPYIKIAGRKRRTSDAVLRNIWAPLLQELVRFLAKEHSHFPLSDDLDHSSRFVAKLHEYFEKYDWTSTWSSQITVITWNHAWMLELENSNTNYFRSEMPSILDLGMSLSMVMHFLTFLSVPLDETLPVFHGSHHGPQLLLGVIAKERYGSSLVIWDHGLLWRERLKALSELSEHTLFTKNLLVTLTTFSTRVIYHKADVIVSCASIGNPEWQKVIGGGPYEGSGSWERVRAKLSPVVNGMETDRFFPCRSSEEPFPCAVMLSHVYPIKDVMNAIVAAGEIINHWNLKSFKLYVYGSTTMDSPYVERCKSVISQKNLVDNVFLMGFGNATKVLPRGWLFLNSSVSEGLPLALGEAGLTGLPVVCTNVGGSYEVTSDSSGIYGAIAPPSDSKSLSRCILKVLAMTDELGNASLTSFIGKPKELEERIHSVCSERRQLGMRYRSYIKNAFGISRYLREHEQLIVWSALRAKERKRKLQRQCAKTKTVLLEGVSE